MTDIDYTNSFSPVVKDLTICILFTLALANNWYLRQVDINNALLHVFLIEDVFVAQPPCFASVSS